MALRTSLLLLLVSVGWAQQPCVATADGTTSVCIASDGSIASITALGRLYALNASTVLEDSSPVGPARVSQQYAGGPITVTRSWAFSAPGVGGVNVTDVFAPGPTSVAWNVSIASSSPSPWSVAIDTQATFSPEAYAALKLWSTWDRGSAAGFPATWVDPLQPSDLMPSGWWDGMYRLGSPRASDSAGSVSCPASDFIVAPLATVVAADPTTDADTGFTLLLSPEDPPFDTCFIVAGSSRSFTFQRFHQRMSSAGPPVELHLSIAGHAADWRGGLGAAVAAFPEHFEPVNPEVFSCCAGTGSYSYYIGPLNASGLADLDYATNWDLSGRFFPLRRWVERGLLSSLLRYPKLHLLHRCAAGTWECFSHPSLMAQSGSTTPRAPSPAPMSRLRPSVPGTAQWSTRVSRCVRRQVRLPPRVPCISPPPAPRTGSVVLQRERVRVKHRPANARRARIRSESLASSGNMRRHVAERFSMPRSIPSRCAPYP